MPGQTVLCFPPVRHVGQARSAPDLNARARVCPSPLLVVQGERGRSKSLEERSLRRVRFPALAGIPDGMEQKPFELRQ